MYLILSRLKCGYEGPVCWRGTFHLFQLGVMRHVTPARFAPHDLALFLPPSIRSLSQQVTEGMNLRGSERCSTGR